MINVQRDFFTNEMNQNQRKSCRMVNYSLVGGVSKMIFKLGK